jgi:hypothetical protein
VAKRESGKEGEWQRGKEHFTFKVAVHLAIAKSTTVAEACCGGNHFGSPVPKWSPTAEEETLINIGLN